MALFCLLSAAPAAALEAVITVEESEWFQNVRATTSNFQGTSPTAYYAPLAVFFEGFQSTPRADIVEYKWDFGDGSPLFYGFNAAHVYETVGNYTARLTVSDKFGSTASATIAIQVKARDGTTYYVDSAQGNDSNVGTAPGPGAWRTAQKAFIGLTNKFYKPGDQVLFKRGQAFEMQSVVSGHWGQGWGIHFGAHGSGRKPLIQYTGPSSASMIQFGGVGGSYISFVDLEFYGESPTGERGTFFWGKDVHQNLLFLRLDIQKVNKGIMVEPNGNTGPMDIFLIDSTIYDVSNTANYVRAGRYALLNNRMDFSGNHLNYLQYLDRGVISGNILTRPAFGRNALRISGGQNYAYPTNNVYVANNYMSGWVDYRLGREFADGKRYNYELVRIAPNESKNQSINDVLFENNTVADTETFLRVGVANNLTVRNNVFRTVSNYAASDLIGLGLDFDQRPSKDIFITDNLISAYKETSGAAGVFAVSQYDNDPAYPGQTIHENIHFDRNEIRFQGNLGANRHRFFAAQNRFLTTPTELAEIFLQHNALHATNDSGMVRFGGTWNDPSNATFLSLQEFKAMTPNANGTAVANPRLDVSPGLIIAPITQYGQKSVTLNYNYARSFTGSPLSKVYLWTKKDSGAWTNTGLASVPLEDTSDKSIRGSNGSFSYSMNSGSGVYYFALQAEDAAGNKSPVPTGVGFCRIRFEAPATADNTPPSIPAYTVSPFDGTPALNISYNNISDGSGTGLRLVSLWLKKDDGEWTETGFRRVSPSGTFSYPLTTGNGVYRFALVALDNAGNSTAVPNAPTSGVQVVVNSPAPSLSIAQPSPSATKVGPVAFVVNYSNAASFSLSTTLTLIKTGSADASWSISGTDNSSRTVTLSNISGNGSLAISLAAGSAFDAIGNSAPAAGPSAAVVVDNVPPTTGTITGVAGK